MRSCLRLLGDIVGRRILRVGRGNLHRDLPCEGDELWILGDEVSLARECHQSADCALVDIHTNRPSGELAVSLLLS